MHYNLQKDNKQIEISYSSQQFIFASLEVRVEHPVGESTHANPDSLKHTVASELVHLGRRTFK